MSLHFARAVSRGIFCYSILCYDDQRLTHLSVIISGDSRTGKTGGLGAFLTGGDSSARIPMPVAVWRISTRCFHWSENLPT
jgi:homoaconitase/3-isopropylmalate dehydratase large subunit